MQHGIETALTNKCVDVILPSITAVARKPKHFSGILHRLGTDDTNTERDITST